MKLQKVSLNFQIDYTILKKVPQYLTIIKTKKGRLSDIKSLNLPIVFTSLVRIYIVLNLSDIPLLAKKSRRSRECNQCEALYIINFEEIAYHQNEVLYIIIAKAFDAR